MMNITISFDNVNEALVAIEAVKKYQGAVEDFTNADVDITVQNVEDATREGLTAGDIGGILKALANMSQQDLEDTFGEGNDKPYRVIKNVGFEQIIGTQGFVYYPIETNISLEQAKEAVNYIIKDVSVGGMSHDEMENLFDCRTSKNIFKNYDLNQIVEKLADKI